MKDVLLEVNNLYKSFESVNAVDDVSFDLFRAETLGLVGESGSGNTTLALCILRAIDPDSGTIRFKSENGWVDLHSLEENDFVPCRAVIKKIHHILYVIKFS